jgi:secreted PhoX family phosphatase
MKPRSETRRRLLPLVATRQNRHGGRSLMTCQYRCGNQCDHPVPNTSDNTYFADVAGKAMSRRGLLTAGAAAGLVLGTSGLGAATAAAEPASSGGAIGGRGRKAPGAIPTLDLDYAPVPPNTLDTVVVPNGYEWDVVIRWGDPVERQAPAFDFDNQIAATQAAQFGYTSAARVKQFMTVPIGAETCGPTLLEDGTSVFVAVQHPGEVSGASVENPVSTWPGGRFAQPSVIVAWKCR